MRRSVFLFAFVLLATLLVAGTAVAVTQQCHGGECQGTSKSDLLYGTAMKDTIFGRGGNDKVYGYGNDDMLKGGPGADVIYGGSGANKMKGGTGADRVYGADGDEVLRGGTIDQANDGAHDFLNCGGGTDTVYFVPGQDHVADNCEIRNPPSP